MVKRIALGGLMVIAACAAPAPPRVDGAVPAAFGEACLHASDCASGRCEAIASERRVCTRVCEDRDGCPFGEPWRCEGGACLCSAAADDEICGNGADDDCDGRIDDCLVCDGIPVPPRSIEHCGSCDRACRGDQVCDAGACACPDGGLECSGACVDHRHDPAHCGGCDGVCAPGQVCLEGTCACGTFGASDVCPGAGCVDLATDEEHCGACGRVCSPGLECIAGTCRCADGVSIDCGGTCVDARADEVHCGRCDRACAPGQECVAGECQCPGGGTACPGLGCVDVTSDAASCGACGVACPTAQRCVAGTCECPVSTETYCASQGACVDLRTDESSCGACDLACASGQLCSGATCRCATAGDTYCASLNRCVSLATDESSCGVCGRACPSPETCVAGVCRCSRTGQSYCPAQDVCVELATDETHCGACGNACSAALLCTGGACRCPIPGQTYCAESGACFDLSADEANCGSCGTACPPSSSCSTGRCVCDDPARTICSGECVDLRSDSVHCGTCANVCGTGRVCSSGACRCALGTLSPEVRLSNEPSDSISVQAASDGTRVALVWSQQTTRTSGTDIIFQLVAPDGAPLAPPIDVSRHATGSAQQPDVVWTGTEWGVTWRYGSEAAYFVRLATDGTPLSTPLRVAPAAEPVFAVRLAHAGASGYGLVTAGYSVRFWPLGPAPLSAPSATTVTSVSSHVSLAGAPDGRFAVFVRHMGSILQIVAADGALAGAPISVLGIGEAYGELAHDGVTWVLGSRTLSTSEIVLRRGDRLETTVVVGSDPTSYSQLIDLAIGSNEIAMVFQTTAGSAYTLSVARLTIPAVATSSAALIAPPQLVVPSPTVRAERFARFGAAYVSAPGIVVGWSDIRWGIASEAYARGIAIVPCP